MKVLLSILSVLTVLLACDNTTLIENGSFEVSILPQPKLLETQASQVVFTASSKLYSADKEVYPLLALLSADIEKLTGVSIPITELNNKDADIVFSLDTVMQKETYTIEVDKVCNIRGGSYVALAQAKSTLLQMVESNEQTIALPQVKISDAPDAAYRGLMIDLARNWHDVNTVKKIIDFAAFYKINYLQLHFTDDPSYTLPSKSYPKLPTPNRHYSFEDLEELESYSKQRGVVIVPEIDVPGHASQFTLKYSEIFGIDASKANPSIINMGNEQVYMALDKLIGEVLSVFKSTPYFHIGGDEARFDGVLEDPKAQLYMANHKLGSDVDNLFNHFIVRMNDIVKKHGKQMCVWEGFGPNGNIEIPKDIIVFPFETNRYLPNELIEDGYQVVNVSWKPLYVVNEKKWSPKTIYNWNIWRWENWWDKAPSFVPIQAEKSNMVIGAQMCAWEQKQEIEIPSLRKRLPAFAERVWNNENLIEYKVLRTRMESLDRRLSKLIEQTAQDKQLDNYNFEKEE